MNTGFFLNNIFLLIFYGFTMPVNDKIIECHSLDSIQNINIKNDVESILNNTQNYNLIDFKIKYKKNLILNSYKNNGWVFYSTFNNGINSKNKYLVLSKSSNSYLENISFFHVKYGLVFPKNTLVHLNDLLNFYFHSDTLLCSSKSFITKDLSTNYLNLKFENSIRKLEFVFIIHNSQFYQCIYSPIFDIN